MYAQQSLQDTLFLMLYGGVAFLALAPGLYLWLRRSNGLLPDITTPTALRRWTAAFFITAALSHVWWYVLGVYWLTDDRLVRNIVAVTLDHVFLVPLVMAILLRSQEEFLMRLVRENAKTEYGRKNNFKGIRNMDDFRRCVPLTTYDDYTPYIERLANGERNILTAYLTEHISIWDYFKGLPQSRWSVQTCYDYCFCTAFYIAGHHGYLTDGLTLNLLNDPIERLASGVTVGNLLDRMLLIRDIDYKGVYVIPISAINTTDETTKSYIEALYVLSQRDISLAICDRYDKMVEMLRYIEKHWPQLTDDIEQGNTYVEPNAERANAIREIMETHHIGTQLVEQLWPGLRCIMVHDAHNLSASFELLRTYCGNNIHFVFTGISSPEGTFSTTLNLDDPQTVLIPDSVFYEFKPKEAQSYNTLLTIDQLEIGRSYELVVSTLSGLYRYMTQKTFLVVGRYHDTPTVIIDKG